LHTTENIAAQFEKTVSNFEITNKRIFSVAGRMFKPDRSCLTDKRFEALRLSTVTNILNIKYFCSINN